MKMTLDPGMDDDVTIIVPWSNRNGARMETEVRLRWYPRHNIEQLEVGVNSTDVAIVREDATFAAVSLPASTTAEARIRTLERQVEELCVERHQANHREA